MFKVGLVQERTVRTLEEVQSYLGSWKFYKNLWKFNKAETCERFLERGPSCVDFDEKLLYYSLLERQVDKISCLDSTELNYISLLSGCTQSIDVQNTIRIHPSNTRM